MSGVGCQESGVRERSAWLRADRSDEPIRLEITPLPTGDERDAVVAAIAVYLATGKDDMAPTDVAERWRTSFRRGSVKGIAGGPIGGWGRGRGGW